MNISEKEIKACVSPVVQKMKSDLLNADITINEQSVLCRYISTNGIITVSVTAATSGSEEMLRSTVRESVKFMAQKLWKSSTPYLGKSNSGKKKTIKSLSKSTKKK